MARPPRRITFTGSQDAALAARLDMPLGPVGAYALFAHCFACSKDIFAASRIAAGLTRHGIAVLRFDFTGLGASEGEFANTNFSSNVADLVLAAGFLRENFKPPTLLIGHSLGGAAVLAAAGEIAEAKAVVTIGAPADAEHVIDNFRARLDDIERTGAAEVSLAGRKFTIRKQFLDDLRGRTLAEKIAGLRRALLVMHAPRDETVGIDNATRIFTAAKHPKSFVSLDTADHLLSRRADAEYAADIIAAWAARFVAAAGEGDAPGEGKVAPQPGLVTVEETGEGKFQQEVASGRHRLYADEPEDVGGRDSGPSPYDYLAIALGACTSMTLRLYAERKKLPLEHVEVEVAHAKVHAKDCAECEGREGRVDRFERRIVLTGNLNPEERARLVEIADKCPVHRTLEQSSVIVTWLKE
ncbi:MAG: bifunctional alpha/beta hydrolase/OsmC family protein [Hyphomicrobiales bacterium]|nr:bifunctional alpha/beta hydrolase/OsmC family protein [Hyphomicrobiales bacterium]